MNFGNNTDPGLISDPVSAQQVADAEPTVLAGEQLPEGL